MQVNIEPQPRNHCAYSIIPSKTKENKGRLLAGDI